MTNADTVTAVISPTEVLPPAARGESDVTCSVATTLVGDGENSVGLDVGEGGRCARSQDLSQTTLTEIFSAVEHIHIERRTITRDHAGILIYIAYYVTHCT